MQNQVENQLKRNKTVVKVKNREKHLQTESSNLLLTSLTKYGTDRSIANKIEMF